MNDFIKKNRKLLRLYCAVAKLIGWVLLLVGVIWFVLTVAGPEAAASKAPSSKGQIEIVLYASSALVFDFFFPGLIILGVTDLIRFLLATEYRPGWILRHAEAVLYAYAIFLVGGAAIKYFWYIKIAAEQFGCSPQLFAQPLLLPIAAKILVLIGLGYILKRIMPVIEESKTLV